MKSFILFFLISLSLWSAQIDTRLYEGNNTIGYYEEIANSIEREDALDQNKTEADIERVSTERMILKKLHSMLSFIPKIDPLPDLLSSRDQNITIQNYFAYLDKLADTYIAVDTLNEEQSNIQSKLQYLNKSIHNMTAEDKKNLQLYQLQYAFYKLKSKNNELMIKAYQTLIDQGTQRFVEAHKHVSFPMPLLEKTLSEIDSEINKLNQERVALNLAKEGELMTHETLSTSLSEKYNANSAALMRALPMKIDQTLQLSLAYLKQGNTDKMLDLFNASKEDVKILDPELRTHFTYKRMIIKELMGVKAGNVSIALSDVEQSVENLYDNTYKYLTKALFVFNDRGISLMDILKVFLILILGFMFGSLYKRQVMKFATVREKLSVSSAKVISNIGYYFIIFITLIISLKSIGLDLSNLGLIAGALSIGIGFGLQTLVSNLAAGIILMFERSIRLGDFIEVSDTIKGTVSDMRMRSTTITTNDNIDVIIPNSSFIQNNVINWTLENDIRRIHIPFSVAYGTSNDKVEKVILEELKNSNINHVKNSPKYTTAIWMTAMGSSSVDYELIVWVRGQSTLKPAGTKSDFLKFIYATLNKHHIEIPFPQLDLHVKQNGPKQEDTKTEIL